MLTVIGKKPRKRTIKDKVIMTSQSKLSDSGDRTQGKKENLDL